MEGLPRPSLKNQKNKNEQTQAKRVSFHPDILLEDMKEATRKNPLSETTDTMELDFTKQIQSTMYNAPSKESNSRSMCITTSSRAPDSDFEKSKNFLTDKVKFSASAFYEPMLISDDSLEATKANQFKHSEKNTNFYIHSDSSDVTMKGLDDSICMSVGLGVEGVADKEDINQSVFLSEQAGGLDVTYPSIHWDGRDQAGDLTHHTADGEVRGDYQGFNDTRQERVDRQSVNITRQRRGDDHSVNITRQGRRDDHSVNITRQRRGDDHSVNITQQERGDDHSVNITRPQRIEQPSFSRQGRNSPSVNMTSRERGDRQSVNLTRQGRIKQSSVTRQGRSSCLTVNETSHERGNHQSLNFSRHEKIEQPSVTRQGAGNHRVNMTSHVRGDRQSINLTRQGRSYLSVNETSHERGDRQSVNLTRQGRIEQPSVTRQGRSYHSVNETSHEREDYQNVNPTRKEVNEQKNVNENRRGRGYQSVSRQERGEVQRVKSHDLTRIIAPLKLDNSCHNVTPSMPQYEEKSFRDQRYHNREIENLGKVKKKAEPVRPPPRKTRLFYGEDQSKLDVSRRHASIINTTRIELTFDEKVRHLGMNRTHGVFDMGDYINDSLNFTEMKQRKAQILQDNISKVRTEMESRDKRTQKLTECQAFFKKLDDKGMVKVSAIVERFNLRESDREFYDKHGIVVGDELFKRFGCFLRDCKYPISVEEDEAMDCVNPVLEVPFSWMYYMYGGSTWDRMGRLLRMFYGECCRFYMQREMERNKNYGGISRRAGEVEEIRETIDGLRDMFFLVEQEVAQQVARIDSSAGDVEKEITRIMGMSDDLKRRMDAYVLEIGKLKWINEELSEELAEMARDDEIAAMDRDVLIGELEEFTEFTNSSLIGLGDGFVCLLFLSSNLVMRINVADRDYVDVVGIEYTYRYDKFESELEEFVFLITKSACQSLAVPPKLCEMKKYFMDVCKFSFIAKKLLYDLVDINRTYMTRPLSYNEVEVFLVNMEAMSIVKLVLRFNSQHFEFFDGFNVVVECGDVSRQDLLDECECAIMNCDTDFLRTVVVTLQRQLEMSETKFGLFRHKIEKS